MAKRTLYGPDAREALIGGVNFLVDAIALTEGPRGQNCILGQRSMGQTPKCTRDGVTVANYVDPGNPAWQMGADLIREACQKTDNNVGDGTTCTAVLARALILRSFEVIETQAINPMALEAELRQLAPLIAHQVSLSSHPADDEDIIQVATISAHGDTQIGELVASAIAKSGRDGIVTAEPSITAETYVHSVAGLELPKSNLLHTAFITHPEEVKAEYQDCRILLWEGVIATAKSLVGLLKEVNATNTPLLIVAGGYEPEALSIIIKNRIKLGVGLPIIAVRMDAYGERKKETLRDIAALTGGQAFTEDLGRKLETVTLADCGLARKVSTDMGKTHIIEGRGSQEQLNGRVKLIRDTMEAASPDEQRILKSRLAALLGGITIIKVGGATVTEMEEKKDRVVDALSAAKAAVRSGTVVGGGLALLRAFDKIDNPHNSSVAARKVLGEACEAVLRQIATNSGFDPINVLKQVRSMGTMSDIGLNASTGDFVHLRTDGVLDPTDVIIEALRNAVAVACSIITTGALVVEVLDTREAHNV